MRAGITGSVQSGILAEETKLARYLEFSINSEATIVSALKALVDISADNIVIGNVVIGLGQPLVSILQKEIPGLSIMPSHVSSHVSSKTEDDVTIPSTPVALWCWLRGSDRGKLFHRSTQIQTLLAPGFILSNVIDSFQYDKNRDLSGYEDGTENPEGNDAVEAAIVQDQGEGLNGSSFVVVQKWLHNFEQLDSMSVVQRDNVIGRHISDNEEFDEAPESAHVKRTAQESFSPEAFMLRRSMPWAEEMNAGLVFVAFGKSFDAFESQLNRMLGKEDGIQDALFSFTRPLTGAYYWCPPIKEGKLDLSVLGV
jgi:putative iron-dependent peroxidase